MNQLKLNFSATKCKSWPKLRFYIDGDLYEDYHFESESATITLPIDLLPGEHELSIELYGKTMENTVVDGDKIVEDQLVTIESMSIDDVELLPMFIYHGRVDGAEHTPQMVWGINGFWRWRFGAPIIDWVLDYKNSYIDESLNSQIIISTFSAKKKNKLLDLLDSMEAALENVRV
jgi:hypothetical protein